MLIGLYGGGRNILPWPGAEIFESKVVGLVMPGDEIVRRFDLGGNARAVVGTSCFHKLCAERPSLPLRSQTNAAHNSFWIIEIYCATKTNMPKRQMLLWGGIPWTGRSLLAENYLLSLSNRKSPKICFIPTASGDSKEYIERFFRRYRRLNCRPAVLPLFNLSVPNVERLIRNQDILFIGGGSTLNMLAIWHARKLEPILKEAVKNGTILSGVSAGSICWFEWGLSDSVSCGKFEPLRCLGYLPGSSCPHFDGEPGRQKIFRNLIARNQIPAGYAADDGVALHFVNEKLVEAVSIKSSANAYQISAESGKARQMVIRPRLLNHE